jgi:ABC-type branched-subunit amino acid transport system substrate-binding protein
MAVTLAVALVAGGCAHGDSAPARGPGFDGRRISLGILTSQTGADSSTGQALSAGNQLFWDELNAKGGVAGRYRVRLEAGDTGDFESVAAIEYDRIQRGVVMFEDLQGTRATKAILPRLQRDGTVATPSTFDSEWVRQPYLLPIGAPSEIQAVNGISYYLDHGGRNTTLCALREDDTYGRFGYDGVEFAAARLGIPIAAQPTFAPFQVSFADQLDALEGAGCQAVVFNGEPGHARAMFSQAAAHGFTPRWIMLARGWTPEVISDPAVAAYLAQHAWLVSEGTAWGDTSLPGMRRFLRAQQRYRPDQPPAAAVVFGYVQAWAVDQILEQAAKAGDLSRRGIRDAATSVGTLRFGGLSGDYRYGHRAADRKPPRASTLFMIDPTAPGGLAVLAGGIVSPSAQEYQFRS